jgi:hypothetical protein
MTAREFLLTDPKIEEAVSNGYDIRLEEHEWIEKMELYALTKQKLNIHSVGGGLLPKCPNCQGTGIDPTIPNYNKPQNSKPEQLGNEGSAKSVCDGCKDIAGFYLGTACPKCNRPFRQVT